MRSPETSNEPSARQDEQRPLAEQPVLAQRGGGCLPETAVEVERLRHELQVHQIELEMQNEELRRMVEELELSRTRYLELYDLAPVGYLTIDEKGVVLEANLTAAHLLGVTRDALVTQPISRFIRHQDRNICTMLQKHDFETGPGRDWELRIQRADGSSFWAHLQSARVQGKNHTAPVYLITLTLIDRQARHEALKSQKLESLGVLAGGIAHDFNNVLTAIFGNISLARFQLHDPEAVGKRLEDAEHAIVRASDLTRQLLTFARGGEPIMKVIQVNDLLKDTIRFVLHGSNARCEFELAPGLWPVEADEGQLAQVIHNLVLNAAQAMPEGGTVTIGTEKVRSKVRGARFVRITVADTGMGIPEENMQKIFDPYFTTKPQGNGLGLATCHSIIKKHGGKIRAESSVGGGTRVIISLPASEQAYVREPDAPTAIFPGSGRVLVMDDDDDIRATARGILEGLGYQVEVAEDGVQAVESYRQAMERGTPFSVAILDLTIRGGMGGREAIEQLLKIDPDVKAIVSSGYSNNPVLANYRDYGFRAVLGKPYRLQEMSKVLKKLTES